jgi:Prokaryotic homologs of the JAB domain
MPLLLLLFLASDPIFDTPAGLEYSRDLMWSHRIGAFDRTERAAFIVDDGDDNLTCVAWAETNDRARASFVGFIPLGTVAIIHTHPNNVPWPSAQDQREATRLGIPIYALTPLTVTKAMPSQAKPVLVENGDWLDPVPRVHRCY